jgi:hypothetical protein
LAKSGLKHIDVGAELTKTEWESEESHELVHGTSFPASPVERQLFYRDNEHRWYIYNGTEWVWLGGGSGGGMQVHGNEYHDPDFATESALASHASAATGVHGAGSYYLLNSESLKPIAGEVFRQSLVTASPPFTGTINGTPTPTEVPYTPVSGENSLIGIQSGAAYWGGMMLYNSTRGTYRKIVTVNTDTNIITTESTSDNWASGDSVTTQSQVNTEAGYVDIDLSAQVPASAYCIWIQAQYQDNSGNNSNTRTLFVHPFKAYDSGLRCYVNACLANEVSSVVFPMEVISQKITIYPRSVANCSIILVCKGISKTP